MRPALLVPVVVALASSMSCATAPRPSGQLTVAAPRAARAAAPAITKVLTIVEENHGEAAVAADMPYLTSLGKTYGRTTRYSSLTHPSLPNYLALAGGSTFGVHDDAEPAKHPIAGPSVFDQALSTRHTATEYAESMPTVCDRANSGRYADRHNPWVYFTGSRASCTRQDVPAGTATAGSFHAASRDGKLPTIGMLTPNLCDDGHDCSLKTADSWLRTWIGLAMQGPDWKSGHLAIVVTFDEDEGHGDKTSTVLTVVIAPSLHGKVVTTALSHLSWSRWMSELVRAKPLHSAASSTSLGTAFGL